MERGRSLKIICPHCGKPYTNPEVNIADLDELLILFKANTIPYRILVILAERFGYWVPTKEIALQVWPDSGPLDFQSSISVNVYQMRKRLTPHDFTIVGQRLSYRGAYKLAKKEGAGGSSFGNELVVDGSRAS